jgi:Transposase DDE domain
MPQNFIAVDREQVFLLGPAVTSSDSTHLAPMITAACEELDAAGVKPPEVVVADAGYWNGPHIEQLVSHGIQTLVCPRRSSARRRDPDATRVSTRSCAVSLKARPVTRSTSNAKR